MRETPPFYANHPMTPPLSAVADAAPSYFTTSSGDRLAYHKVEGKMPGVVFIGGFKSDMTGSKALRLQEFCEKTGHAYLRFDYHAHGQSEGRFEDGSIGRWAGNAIAVLDEFTDGKQILVGSSMGGWMMLLVALARPEKVAGLIGIAAAPDFTEDLIRPALNPEQQRALQENGVFYAPSDYGDPYPITRHLLDEGRKHLLLRGDPLPLSCPVRLLHGMQDADVPWMLSVRLANALPLADVQLTCLKDGNHRLSSEDNLRTLEETLAEMLQRGASQ